MIEPKDVEAIFATHGAKSVVLSPDHNGQWRGVAKYGPLRDYAVEFFIPADLMNRGYVNPIAASCYAAYQDAS